MGKKRANKIAIKGQEFVFTKGSKIFGEGVSKEKAKSDAKFYRKKGWKTRIKKIEGKYYLYISEGNSDTGTLGKIMREHDRNVKPTPEPTKEARRSHGHFFRNLCIILCVIGVLIVGCLGFYYYNNPPENWDWVWWII